MTQQTRPPSEPLAGADAAPPAPVTETAAQRVERIKRERPSWSILDDIKAYAPHGFSAIPADDLSVRFRAWGLYTQGDGGGTRGEEMPFFMMRVRTPNGLLTGKMVRTISDIADKYARSTIDITNRQNFQLHWLRIEDVPQIWSELEQVGWGSMGSCGDNTRTVTGCPLAGVEAHELIDASPIAEAIDRAMNGNPDFANLPRKFKITITGCSSWCTYPEINDIGATAVRRGTGSDAEIGFHIRLGGGLSTRPHLAKLLPAFVKPEQMLDVVMAITGIFRDSDELRRNRAKARMKFLFISNDWTVEKFLTEIERRIGYSLAPLGTEVVPDGHFRDHVGVHPQKQPGLSYAGFSVPSGRISPNQLRAIATLAETYGNGTLRNTAEQNIIVLNIPTARLPEFRTSAKNIDIPLEGAAFQRGTVSCTGSEYCKLALTETKVFSIRLAKELDDRLPGFSEAVSLNVTGCPNSCGQQWIADVGLQGVHLTRDGATVEGFDIFVGGALGLNSGFARRVGYRAAAEDVPDSLERLFQRYRDSHTGGESFRQWSQRAGMDVVKAALTGASASA